eukprot:TRINITY_DN6018_c0_g1_i1.p1 TRINITY_DN6018_c0_g1~~TRINITY_DN6018_c0_g1_i1.p1  ORF type:complete len:505 (-),score=148.48 TRINITY_DN6018_c0_g1_i1:6-1520(-)
MEFTETMQVLHYQEWVGDVDTFEESLLYCVVAIGVSVLAGLIARYIDGYPTNGKVRFGVPGSWAFYGIWRFAMVRALLGISLAFYIIRLSVAYDQWERSWMPMAFLSSQFNTMFVGVSVLQILLICWSFFGIVIQRRNLPADFTGNESILLAGCNRGRSLVSLAKLLDQGHITVCDPWNSIKYFQSWRYAAANLQHSNLEEKADFQIHDHPRSDLRNIASEDASIDIAILDQIGSIYDRKEWHIVASELDRVLKPGGSIIDIRISAGYLDMHLQHRGYSIAKRTFAFGHFPFLISMVEWKKSDGAKISRQNRRHLESVEYLQLEDTFGGFFKMNFQLEFMVWFLLVVQVGLIFLGVFAEFSIWEKFEFPEVFPEEAGNRFSFGFVAPLTLGLGWQLFEACYQTRRMCQQGRVFNLKNLFLENFKLNLGFAIGGIIIQGLLYTPQVLGGLFLGQHIPYGIINMVGTIMVLTLTIAIISIIIRIRDRELHPQKLALLVSDEEEEIE